MNKNEYINSPEYWEERFENNNWEINNGKEQSKYFGNLAMDMIPEWFTKIINKNNYSICDLGCAEGDAIPALRKKFFNSKITGTDISPTAIKKAAQIYKDIEFKIGDIFADNAKEEYDVVFCSNVIEHFPFFQNTLRNILRKSRLYTIILCPLREDFEISEHETVINTSDIPCILDNNYLIYAKSVIGDIRWYGGEQILLIYSKLQEDQNALFLSDLADNLRSVVYNESEKAWKKMNDELYLSNENRKELSERIFSSEKIIEELKKQLDKKQEEIENIEHRQLLSSQEILVEKQRLMMLQQDTLQKLIQSINDRIYWFTDDVEKRNREEDIAVLSHQKEQLEKELCRLDLEKLSHTRTVINRLMNSRGYLLALYMRRLENQMIKGTFSDKIDFFKYTINKIFRTKFKCRGIREYDPLIYACASIQEILEVKRTISSEKNSNVFVDSPCIKNTCQIFIFSGVPFYDVGGGQRCSQLTKTFDKMGYEVHYIYAYDSSESKIFEMYNPAITHCYLYDIDESWILKRLKEQVIFIFEAPFKDFIPYLLLAKKCNIPAIYEHIDNWDTSLGCLLYDKKSFDIFVSDSDFLVATSIELVKQLNLHTNRDIVYLPNAVDINIFEPSYKTDFPDDLKKGHNKTLLYYGSLWGEWFDWELLKEVALKCKDSSFNIIGDYAPIKDQIINLPENIHFLGLKRQTELPAYLKESDIAILPFKNCDIGRYVSPLKIFEYIAMGKYVLSEPLPDVLGYPNTFCSSQASEWAKVIHNEIKIEEYGSFVSSNNWYERCTRMLDMANIFYLDTKKYVNKISIVVLNHNNDKVIQRCINSLLIHNSRYQYEIIVVDNKSTDGSVDRLNQNFGNKIKLIKNNKNGCSSGRNLGVENASGDWIVFLDSDQWVVSDTWLDAGLFILSNRKGIGAVSWGAGWFTNEDCTGPIVDYFENRAITSEKLYRNDLSYLATDGFIISKALFRTIGGFDEFYDPTCFEDTDLSFAIKHEGLQIAYCPYLNIAHLPHQTTNSGSIEHKKLLQRNGKYFINKWKEKNLALFESAIRNTKFSDIAI